MSVMDVVVIENTCVNALALVVIVVLYVNVGVQYSIK